MDPRLDAEAWDRLEAELKNANAQLEKDPRGACRRALEAILFFIHQQRPQWTADRTHTSLVELWTGLNDRDNGRVPQILAPLSSANRHPDPSWRQMMQGFATSAVERLIEADPNPNVSAASEQVVEVWNKCTGEGLDSDTVRSWYYRRDKPKKKNDLSSEVLTAFRALLDPENLDPSSAGAIQDALMQNGLASNLKNHLPKTPSGVLEFLASILTVLKRHQPN